MQSVSSNAVYDYSQRKILLNESFNAGEKTLSERADHFSLVIIRVGAGGGRFMFTVNPEQIGLDTTFYVYGIGYNGSGLITSANALAYVCHIGLRFRENYTKLYIVQRAYNDNNFAPSVVSVYGVGRVANNS